MADGFGFNGKKELEQTKWRVSFPPGSKTVGKGLRDGADGLDEQETQQCRSLGGTALYVGQDRPETQYATKEAARFMSGPTRAAKCMLKRLCKYYSEAPVLSWSLPYQGGDRCELGRGTGGIALDVLWMGLLADCGAVNCRE